MNYLDKLKQNQIRTMFFTLKMLSLFFCSIPLLEFFLKGASQQDVIKDQTSFALALAFIVLSLVTLLWMIMDFKRDTVTAASYIEVGIFFLVCLICIILSGAHQSYYKFVFIFMIVLYTIEKGMRFGMALSAAASGALLTIDLLLYNTPGVNKFFENDIVLSAMFVVVAWTLGFYVKLEKEHIGRLKDYANYDGLTKIYNHRFFQETLKELCETGVREQIPVSLAMFDLDHFKIYNDMYGHQQGDVALCKMAEILQDAANDKGIVCRYGGEEFCIIMDNTSMDEAIREAESIRKTVCDFAFEGQENLPGGSLTVSVGVAELSLDGKDSYKNLISRADAALYRAKFMRRNSVQVYSTIFDELNQGGSHGSEFNETLPSIKTLITVIHARDSYTFSHTERVVSFCSIVADSMKLSMDEKKQLIFAAYLHDLGKINVSKETLISDQPLTDVQREELRCHPGDSADIIGKIGQFEPLVPIVLQHHERYDGTGYPTGLKGDNIHRLARILSLADSFDAMTSARPYQQAKTYDKAFDEIRRCSGTQFDPKLSEMFIEAIKMQKIG